MWKRLVLIALALSLALALLPAAPTVAQDDNRQNAAPLSGRYQFQVPASLIVARGMVDELSELYPSEAVAIASSVDVLAAVRDEGIEDVLWGADRGLPPGTLYISSLYLPGRIFQIVGLETSLFEESVVEDYFEEIDAAPGGQPLTLSDLAGTSYRAVSRHGVYLRMDFLQTSDGGMVLTIGMADAGRQDEVNSILGTFAFLNPAGEQSLGLESSYPAELAPGALTVDIPSAWTYSRIQEADFYDTAVGDIDLDDIVNTVTGPDAGLVYVAAFAEPRYIDEDLPNLSAEDISSLLMGGAVFSDLNGIRPFLGPTGLQVEALTTVLTNAAGGVDNLTVQPWQNANLQGTRVDFDVPLYLELAGGPVNFPYHIAVIVVPSEYNIAVLVAGAPAAEWGQYAALVDSIFATAR